MAKSACQAKSYIATSLVGKRTLERVPGLRFPKRPDADAVACVRVVVIGKQTEGEAGVVLATGRTPKKFAISNSWLMTTARRQLRYRAS